MLAEKLPLQEGEDEILAFPLSFAQQRLWFLDQLYPGNVAYNVPFAVRIAGDLDVPTLAAAFAALVERHEPLRTTFATIGSEPVQVVSDPVSVPVPCVDLRGLAPEEREGEARRLAREEARRPFDLRRGPLLRVALLRTGGREHRLLLMLHHIVCDGWSLGVLLGDIAALYEPLAAGRAPELPELPVQYADFALWQREWLQGEALESRLAYWREQLAGAPGLLELPTDRPRPAAPGFEGGTVRFSLPEELSRRALALAAELRCSPFMLLLAAFDALLFRYTGQEDVLVGTPIANRNRSDLEPLIGFFVNTLVLRARPRPDLPFAALAEEVRAAALEAFARQDVPFEKLLEELQPERSASVTPLFQVMLVFQNAPAGRLEIPGLELEGLLVESDTSKLDLTLHLAEDERGLRGTLVYRAELFDAPTVRRLAAHLETLLAGAVAAPETRLADLPLLSPVERQQAVLEWNDSGPTLLSGLCVHELFEEQAARDPGAPALVFEEERLTRGELNARANRLAWRLRELGVGPEVPVGLCLERSAGAVVALLAVLKAGGAYLPLDPALPAERLLYILELSAAPVLVTRGGLAARLGLIAPAVLDLDEADSGRADDPPRAAGPGNLAYILFTSGSTGRPKGVAVEHRHLLAYLAGVGERLRVPAGGSYATVSTLAADLGNTAIFPALCLGGCLHVLAEDRLADPEAMEDYFLRHRIDCLKIVPSHLAALRPAGFRGRGPLPRCELVLGGEASHWEEVERLRSDAPCLGILNHYGPTESTVGVLTFRVPAGRPDRRGRLPLGRPLPGARVHLLDRSGNPVLAGVTGEIHIGGASLTRGYLCRPDLTAERFVPDPFGEPGGRLYRTGDLARRLPDGLVDFLGRTDDQVKVRGYRVEPGEIEAILAEHPDVRDATVQLRGGRLVAYALADCDAAELRRYLQERLPAYMVPAAFVPLERIPLTAQGKVDRRALPDAESLTRESVRVTPRTPVEVGVAAVWSEVLGIEEIGVHDSFFGLGGHSLLAAQAASRLRRAFQVDLPLRALFEAPTVAGLAARIEGASGRARPPLLPLPRPVEEAAVFPVSFAQQRLWFLDRLEPGSALYSIPRALHLEGSLDPAALAGAFQALVDRHESLRTTFAEGPVQVVAPARRHELPVVDLSGLDFPGEEIRRLAAAEAARPFDLGHGPLLRTTLVRQGPREHVLLVTIHHIVSDAWSAGVLLRDMAALLAGEPLPRLPVQVADIAVWQRQWLQGEEMEARLATWRRRLAGAPPVLELPADRPRPPVQSYRGDHVRFELPPGLCLALRELAAGERATPFMALLAGFAALLFRYTGETDLPIGTPVAGRTEVEMEGLIGFFVNTLVVRADLSGEPSFRELLGRVRERVVEAQALQDVPFERLVEELAPERSLSHSPLFQVMAGLVNLPLAPPSSRGLRMVLLDVETPVAKFDLNLAVLDRPEGFTGTLEYASDLFHRTTALRLAEHLRAVLEDLVRHPERTLSEARLMSEAERQQMLVEWNDTAAGRLPGLRLHDLFAAQAERTPDALAVMRGGEGLTFRELRRRSLELAARLRGRGVGPDVLVGIRMDRTPEMVVALLGVLEAGGAYVPLDPAYPEERLRWIVEDSRLALVLRPGLLLDGEEEEPRGPEPAPENLAYVIYTSGSTGRPKGVAISHASAVDFLAWARELFSDEDRQLVLASTSLNFDIAVIELFGPLCWGGTLVLVDDALSLPRDLEITLINTVPSAFAELLEEGAAPSTLRTVSLGGEALRQDLAGRVHARGTGWRLLNLYGPTEDTVYSTFERVEPGAAPTIGRPAPNGRAHVLGPSLRPVPIGVPGELLLGGAGQARGYLGRPDLTAERFVPDPVGGSPGARLYRTGDRVRRLPDGRLDFLRRLDHQVKIRGFRIEPGEIETVLTGHPAVREAVIVAREALLVAYVAGNAAPAALRAHLEGLLPVYMVPQRFVLLEALPRTPNGKVDRRALPEPEAVSAGATEFAPPRTPREELLAGIWESVLGVERVERHDHFFDLGGHSLLATRVLTRIREAFQVELPLRAVFQAPTLAELASRIGEGTAPAEPIRPVPRDGRLPLSYAQQRLWFLHQLEPGSPAYNLLVHLRLAGALSAPALEAALAEMVRRHEVLRTRYALVDEEPVQIPEPFTPFRLPLVDLAGLPEEGRRGEMARLAREEARRPFDLGRAPVLRALLARRGRDEHELLVSIHHVAADGWSLEILAREVAALYAGSPLPDLPIQVADFAAWQRRRPLNAHLAFWRERLAGAPPLLALSADRPRPTLWSGRGATLPWRMPRAAAFRESGATLFMGLLAAFQALLQRWSGADDVVVGTPVSGRPTVETEALIGCFVNTLVLRGDLSGRPSARDLLARSRNAVLEAHDHQELPFEALVEALSPERSLSHAPLFQVLLTVQPAAREAVEIPGLAVVPAEAYGGSAKFDLHLAVAEADGALRGSLEFATDLFDATTARRLLDHLERLLEGFAARPNMPVAELPLLSEAERHQALVEASDTGAPFPEECLHRLFEDRAAERPGAVALSWQGADLTCAELNGRANRLARHLRSLGVGPEVRVEVCLDRTPDLVAALLAVLKAGGAYVPLDPAWPAERLRAIAAQSQAPVLLTRAGIEAPAEGRLRVELDSIGPWPKQDLEGGALPGNLAYVIYTSGSTGVPKGVAIEHRAAAGLLGWAREVFPPEDLAGVLASTSVCFDLSVFELFVPLAWGGRVVLVQDALRLAELPPEAGVTLVNTVPSAIDELLRLRSLPSTVRTVNLAGEPLERALVERIPREARVLNLYGPSEDTTYSTWEEVPRVGEPTIGRPVTGTRACLLDAALQPVPPGVPGELCLGGAGSARGYLGRPDLTAAAWVPDPFGPPGARLYRTGDLARLRRDGRLEFLGRRDHQVKVRGFRIELGEVEAALASHPAVDAAVVVARGTGADRHLVAYVVGRDEGLRAFLQERLPSYMVPGVFVVLDTLPLSPNGKVDRRALPELGPARPEGGVPPRDELERRLAGIWEDLLGVRPVGVRDDFFDLGGHSLLAVRLLARIRRATGRDLPLAALFQRSTVEGLAALLREGDERPCSPLVAIRPEGARRPLFCVHPVGGNVLCYRDLGRHLSRPLYALEYPGGLGTVEAMAERYLEAVREVWPRGPYHLAGWSSGGVIAFEMARRLAEAGEEVELALLDTFAPANVPDLDETKILLLHAWGLGLSHEELAPLSEEERLCRVLDRLPEDMGIEDVRRYLEAYRTILDAVRAYEPRPWPGRALLVRCAEREDYGEYAHLFGHGPSDPVPGWSGLAGRLEVRDVQTTHNRLVQEPAVAELAAILDRPRTFADVLRRRASEGPDRPLYLFLDSEGREAESLTYGELDRQARAIAAELQRLGGEGERALLLYPPGLEFLAAFWGCLYAGVVAVPAYPPRSGRTQPRLWAVAADAEAALVLAPAAIAATREALAGRVAELGAARWIATDELALGAEPREPATAPDDPAFLQYTSGSTADPKGVVVTHANLLANEETIQRAFGQSEASVVVGWLPLYHDMGLIGNALQPVFSGGRAVLMSPLTFLQRPARWLEAISRYRATTSGGPSFAYELCVRKVGAEERAGLDLSTWSVAFNGAEPVRAETLRRFAEAFAPCGFRPEAAYPCYGLAESTLFVTGIEPGRPPVVRGLRADALERDEAVPAREGEPARELVACGDAWPGHRVVVVDSASGAPCEPGRVGEVWVSGPSVAAGYWNRPEATAETFGARLEDGSGPFLRTGDLGFFADGELFVTGRLKDLIILRGRNHYPQDFERTAEMAHPALRPGSGAAFSVERDGEERLVVVQDIEHGRREPGELEAIAEAARRAVAEEHEVAVEEVVLLRSGTVPKTSSGKVRRRACREAYLAGELVVVGRSLAEAEVPASGLREEVAGLLRLPPSAVEPDRPLVALGLDSLAAVELKGRVEKRFGVSLSLAALLERATLADVAAEVGRALAEVRAGGGSLSREAGEGRGGSLILNQRALWFVERLSPGSYNLAGAARVRDGLDPEAVRRAFQALADRHPALRTTYEEQDGEPVRRVHERMEIDFGASTHDLLAPFDLRRGPLMRVRLSPLEGGDALLALGLHHLAADFGSLAILLRELGALYRGESLPLPGPEPVPREDTSEATWAWWQETLAGDLPVLDLATDRPRPPVQTYHGASRALRLEAVPVRAWASQSGATLHTALLAAFHALLHRYTGQPDILLGIPTAEPAEAVGYFVNPVVVRASLAGEPTAAELLARVKAAALGALEHAGFPFPLLAERLQPERDASRSPLFQTMLAFQKARRPEEAAFAPFALGEAGATLELGGLTLESVPLPERRVPFDLLLMMAEAEDGLLASLQYNSDLFDAATAGRMLGHLSRLFEGMASNPERRVAHLDLLSEPERRQLASWAVAPSVDGSEECLHRLISAQVERTPDAVALVRGSRSLTYRELWDRAGALAARLRKAGVGPELRVGLFAGRKPELVIGMLAVLRAGGAYVPLDPAYPAERLAFLLKDSRAAVVLVEPGRERELPASDARILLLGEEEGAADLPDDVLPANLAYLIYTSGSTGRPKAVALTHASAVALARWAREVFPDEDLAGVLAATSISFDLSVFEIFVPLCWGGRVVLAENALELPPDQDVRLVNTVPSAMAELVRARALPPAVRTVNLAGEALPPELVRDLYRTGTVQRVFNLYGPSEDTTYSTFALQEREARSAPIGLPVAGTGAWLLDAAGLGEVPLGARGEIHLGGEGLARGYFGRPGLTAERFVPSPFEPGARLYRTGDLARRRPDGSLEYLGRIDHQVKIRGFRVELGEVEAALRDLPGVREAVVLAVEGARLVAFTTGAAPDRQALRRRLPEALVPSAIVPLQALPLTPNGKVDRKALARLAADARISAAGWRAPCTPGEALLAGIWGEILGADRVGADDDFFALGGHSLLASRMLSRAAAAFGVELPLRRVFESPTLAGLARALAAARAAGRAEAPLPSIVPLDRSSGEELPLSFGQERLWFLDRLAPGSAVYNMPVPLAVDGPLAPAALAAALAALLARHEVLRAAFPAAGGRPRQVVAPPPAGPARVPVMDLAALPTAEREREAARLTAAEARRPFDLAGGPLLRVALLRLAAEQHRLLLTLHHIVGDAWSLGILVGDLAVLYAAARAGRPAALPALAAQYADYAHWQRERVDVEAQLAFWREHLRGAPSELELPGDRPHPARPTTAGAVAPVALDAGAADALAARARAWRATPFMLLLAVWQALLARWSGARDLVVGVPVSHRPHPELERLVGFFVNTLPLRAALGDDPPFAVLAARTREAALAALAHADLPLERLVEELDPARAAARNPLFEVLFVFQNVPLPALPALPAAGLAIAPLRSTTGTAKLDLSLLLEETAGGGIAGDLEHATDLFDRTTAARLARWYATLAAAALAAPETRLSELPVLLAAERQQLLVEWNDHPALASPPASLLELVHAQARRHPDLYAVVDGDERLTYAELERRAVLLARHLCARGVGPEVPVGLLLPRSAGLVLAMLGVIEAGGVYVPLDPALPAERLAFMTNDAGIRVLVTTGSAGREAVAPPGGTLRLDDAALWNEAAPAAALPIRPPDALLYLLYTSGSTGEPKGVGCAEGGLLALLADCAARQPLAAGEACAWWTSPGFDVSAYEVFSALLSGGALHPVPAAAHLDGPRLAAWLEETEVASAYVPPFLLGDLAAHLRQGRRLALRRLLVGVEPIPEPLLAEIRALAPGLCIVNGYGPTETTVCATLYTVGERPARPGRTPIGRAVWGGRVVLLDEHLRPVPLGAHGELHVGGGGLARGYHGRPDLTAERFVPDPQAPEPGARLYRTGDLARSLADGRLEFLGRRDRQVKVRGLRVELGEVEAALAAQPQVRESAVVAVGEGEARRLVAYVVPAAAAGGGDLARDLRRALRARLPEPMVPAHFVPLAALPLTPNGKVDRRALPDPGPEAGERTAPRDALEEGVAAVWAEVLGLDADEVGRDDDFFGAGGHSLLAPRLAARLRETLGAELPLRSVFEHPTVAGLALAVAEARGTPALPLPPIERVPRQPSPPLALSQERLWFLDQLEPGSPVYNLPLPLRLQGDLDPQALRRAFQGIVDRHEALRTTFRAVAGKPVQEAAPELPFPLPLVDLVGLAPERGRAESLRLAADEALRPFSLERGPLLRATLLRLGGDEHALLLNVHHIVADGRSMGVLLRELKALYGGETLPELPVQYADYAAWQRRWLDGEALAEPLAWWRQRLAGAPAVMELPLDRPRPAVLGFRGGSSRLELGSEEMGAFRGLGRSHRASLFLTLLAVLAALLRRVTGQGDLVLGTPTANRPRPELEPLVGFFVNNLVLRLDASGDPRFRDLLAGVREAGLAAYAREIPFEKLIEELRPERDLSHNPLYQVVFALEGTDRPDLSLPGGVRLSPLPVGSGTAKFDLALYMEEGPGGLSGLLEYNRDLFDNTTAARLLKGFAALAREAARDPERRLFELPLLDEAERHQALVEANDTAAERPSDPFVHRWIEARAAGTPEAPALRREGRSLTYGEMNRRANRLAHRLIRLGVRPETRVAVALERSPELIVAMLAIWKAGGAYVPLDVAYPKDRLEAMLLDSGAAVLLTFADFPLPESQAVPLVLDESWSGLEGEPDTDPGVPLLPENLVYVIYTSGSTGRPKGVMIQHASLASYAVTAARAYGVVPADRVLQFCSVSFDISIEEIVPCLTQGAELVLRTDAMIESIPAFLDACREWGLTMLSLPTAYWHEIVARVDAGALALPPSLRLVIIAGERALPERLVAWQRHAPERPRLINTYGLTESTIISTVGDLTASPADGIREVSIGRTIPDTELYLLDRALQPVPLGVAGELFIGGGLLARGYHDRPGVTAERFVPHVFSRVPGERLYRTGDLARALPNGELEFLGRGDHQVKIRGYRIELGEIEAALARHPDLDAVAVAAPEDRPGQKRLVAYVVPGRCRPAPGELRTFLAGSLPEYMLPGVFFFLDALPLTPNGKVDRGALPSARDQRCGAGDEYLTPRDEVERAVAEIWQRALGIDRVGIHDNFFDLGGHSLLLIQVAEGLKERFGRAVPMVELFKHPTVDSLARHLSQARESEERTPEPLQEVRDRVSRARITRAAAGPDRFLDARRRFHQQKRNEEQETG